MYVTPASTILCLMAFRKTLLQLDFTKLQVRYWLFFVFHLIFSNFLAFIFLDMETIQNKNVLISHATVTFVTKEGATLYVRSADTYVFAPVSTFPPGKADCSLLDRVQIGRTVVVRALPAEKFLDLQVKLFDFYICNLLITVHF